MPKYKPFPLNEKLVPIVKSLYNIESDEEAKQPNILRGFFNEAANINDASEVEKEDIDINFNKVNVNISILRPVGSKNAVLPVILFLHGGGWFMGGYNTHKNLTNELVNALNASVVFVNYSPSPEAKYPIALEECYAALCWVQENAKSINVDPTKLVVAGDSAGGNLSIALSILAKSHGNMGITYQLLFYPVTDVDFHSESYEQHKNDIFLPRITMECVWDYYLNSTEEYKIPTAVPMSAPIDVLKGLPPAFIITAERDVLRSEGEKFAGRLTQAGVNTVCVRYLNAGHGFLTTNDMKPQGKAAIAQTVDVLRKHWGSKNKL